MKRLLINILLFLVASVLFIVLAPIWLVYSIVTRFSFNLNALFISMAIWIDQLGNVFLQYLFDDIMIKKNWYKFGVDDETISSALGKNAKKKTLTGLWKFLCFILWKIDTNHCIKSIHKF